MRKPILSLSLLVAACQGPAPEDYALVEDFTSRSIAASCEVVDLGSDIAPSEIRLASDSTWLVLDRPQQQIAEYDDQLRLLSLTPIPATGPAAAAEPVSVAALGDTAFAVAGRGQLRLVILSRTGREPVSVPLEFIPQSLEATSNGEILITAMTFGDRPRTLVQRFRDGAIEPIAVPKRSYPDMTINALGNSALVETLPDGNAVVVHQFFRPRAFRIAAGGTVQQLAAPTPSGTREQIDFVPQPPVTDDQLPLMLSPGMALSPDPLRSELYLMTRSGREIGGRLERAILRVSDDLEFIQGYTLNVHATSMVYLPRRQAAVVVDDMDRFHLCSLPREDAVDRA